MKYAYYETIFDDSGNLLDNASISVFLSGTTNAAKVYVNGSQVISTPQTTTNSYGFFEIQIDDDDYDYDQTFDIKIEKTGYVTKTLEKLNIIGGSVKTHFGVNANEIAVFEDDTGKFIKSSGITIDKLKNNLHFLIQGDAQVSTKIMQCLIENERTVSKILVYADTAPSGSDLIVDINKNGSSIFSSSSDQPKITDGSHSGNSTNITSGSFSEGDRLSIDIDQVGSTTAGGNDLLVTVVF